MALAILPFLFAAPPDDPKADALARLRGRWMLEEFTVDGQRREVRPGTECLVKDDQWTVSLGGQKYAPVTIELDPGKSPATIDLVSPGGTRGLGIYRLDGDILTTCQSAVGDRHRPEEFRSEPGRKQSLMKFRRIGR